MATAEWPPSPPMTRNETIDIFSTEKAGVHSSQTKISPKKLTDKFQSLKSQLENLSAETQKVSKVLSQP